MILLLAYRYPAFTMTTTGPHKIETDETWSIFDLLNQNWAVCSLEFYVPYDTTVRLYVSIK